MLIFRSATLGLDLTKSCSIGARASQDRHVSEQNSNNVTLSGTRYSSNGSNYEKFSEYAIKIVMASDSTNMVPLVESMGGLALIDPIQPAT